MQKRRRQRERQAEAIWYLAERYRAGKLTADDLTPAEREAVMVWLVEHPKARLAKAQ